MGRRKVRRTLLRILSLVFGATLLLSGARSQDLAAVLPPQNLSDALEIFAKETGYQLVYRTEVAADLKTLGAEAGLSAEDTLRRLLRGTGLSFAFVNDRTVAIFKASGAAHSGSSEAPPESMLSPPAISPNSSSASNSVAGNDNGKGDKSMKHRGLLTRITAALALVAASIASAAEGSQGTSSNGPDLKLEEIVVTAQRREETVDKVPISITAFSRQTMDDLHLQKLADLATIVPGLYLTPVSPVGQDYSNVAIRGILSSGNAPTTQFYIDETPIAIRQMQGAANSGSPLPYMFDLDRVEVLRGPQGTLFGASAMGGAIRFITPQPNLNDSSGFVKSDVAYYLRGGNPSYEAGAAYGAPIVAGKVGFRVSAWYQRTGGFIDQEDPATGQTLNRNINSSNAYVIRPAFTWAPSDALTITPALFLQHKDSQNPDVFWQTGLPNSQSEDHIWGGYAQPMTEDLRVGSLAIKYTIAGLTFQSDTSYLDRKLRANNDFTEYDGLYINGNASIPGVALVPASFHSYEDDITFTHAWQQEFRLSSQDPSSRFTWVVGAYYRRAVQGLTQLLPPDLTPLTEALVGKTSLELFGAPNYVLNGQVLDAYADFRATDIAEATFGDITANLTPRLKATAGVRVEHEVVEHQSEILAGPLQGFTYSSIVLPDQVATPVTPRFALAYQYTDRDLIYASVAKGYRAGGGNNNAQDDSALCHKSLAALGLSSAPKTFDSDSLWSYEIGAKDQLFDQRLSIEASAFYIKWSNIQSGINLASCNEAFTANRGRAITQGFDFQLAAVIAEGLKVRALVGYTNAYYPDAIYNAPPPGGVAPLLHAAGDKLNTTRPWNASANAEYSHDISSLWADARTYLRADYRWASGAYSQDPHVANYDSILGAYPDAPFGVVNFRLGVTHGGLDVSAYLNNVTNADPLLGFNHVGAQYSAAAILPRTVGATVWYRF